MERRVRLKIEGLKIAVAGLLFSLFSSLGVAQTLVPPRGQSEFSYDVKVATDALVKGLEQRFTFPQARVAVVRKEEVLLEVSKPPPLGVELIVYRPGKPIVDPETGKRYPGFDEPVALVLAQRREGRLVLAQVVKRWGKIKENYVARGPEQIYVRVNPTQVKAKVSIEAKEVEELLRLSIGQSLLFKLLSEKESLPQDAYGVSVTPVITEAGGKPLIGLYVDSLVSGRSLFTLQKRPKLIKTASYAELMAKRKMIESGEWEGYATIIASRVFRERASSIAVGDVDKDGKNELLVLGETGLSVYDVKGKEFDRKYRYKLPARGAYAHRYLWIDTADINDNGVPEVFITHVVEDLISGFIRPHLESMVLEIDPKKHRFKLVQKKMPYYLRVVRGSVDNKGVLLGQRMGSCETYEGPVVQLAWDKNRYTPLKKPTLSFIHKISEVYGITWDDMNNDGKREVALMDDDGYLGIYNERGMPLWESPDSLGVVQYNGFLQTPRFPKIPAMKDFNPESVAKRNYVKRRLVTHFLKGDGKVALFAVMNDIPSFVVAGVKLESPWRGVNGRAIKLEYMGSGRAMGPYFDILWETPKFKDLYAEDLALGDVNNDGVLDLVLLSYNKKVGKVRVDIYPIPGA